MGSFSRLFPRPSILLHVGWTNTGPFPIATHKLFLKCRVQVVQNGSPDIQSDRGRANFGGRSSPSIQTGVAAQRVNSLSASGTCARSELRRPMMFIVEECEHFMNSATAHLTSHVSYLPHPKLGHVLRGCQSWHRVQFAPDFLTNPLLHFNLSFWDGS
jgi:hypothetical protein